MKEVNPNQKFDEENRRILREFIADAEKHQDSLSGSVLATITQFLINLRITIRKTAHDDKWITPVEIIESQVKELRRCVVDLEAYKERLIQGESKQ